MRFTKLAVATALGAATMGVGASASAQPIVTGGIVNVTVTDVVDDVTVTVEDFNVGVAAALNLAANVCDVNVNVLAKQLRNDGGATCENATSDVAATIDQI